MTDDGLIEGSAPEGDAFTTVFEADPAADTGTVYDVPDYADAYVDAFDYTAPAAPTASYAIVFGDVPADAAGAERAGCGAAACPHPVAHPAEADWEQLVSAVPVEGQTDRFKPRCEGMSYPTEEDFRSAVAAVRPLDPDAFSLQRLRTGWTEEVAAVVADWPGLLKSKLADLAAGWAGTDFDAFTDRADQARALVQGVLDDIEDAAQELKHREEAIYTLQGGDSGEVPYPAPLVGAEGEWTNLVAVHVRPAWWHGDCIQMTCEQAEEALKLGGADPQVAADVRAFIEERAGGALGAVASLASPERLLAAEEAKARFDGRIAAELSAYAERQAAIDEAITEKRTGQSEQLESLSTGVAERPCPDGADGSYMDLQSPAVEQPEPPVPPQATQDPSPVPPGGDGSVHAETAATESGPDPWESGGAEGDEGASGGLASGGGFTGGGSVATALPSATTAPGGTGGAFTAGAGAPAPFAPAPTTGPATAGGSGSGGGGVRAGVVGGQQQSNADARKRKDDEEDEEPDDEDLTFRETENVWGYVRPGDDPYN